MSETELLVRKTESLPPELFEEAVHYIDYLSQKAQAAHFAAKLAEAEHEAAKPDAVWLDENDFWRGDERSTPSGSCLSRKKTRKK